MEFYCGLGICVPDSVLSLQLEVLTELEKLVGWVALRVLVQHVFWQQDLWNLEDSSGFVYLGMGEI